jgi:hypothetical protein
MTDFASSNHGDNWDNVYDDEPGQGQQSKDDDIGWVLRTITKLGHQYMERFFLKQIKLTKLKHQGWDDDAADYFWERDQKYDTSELIVPAAIQPEMDQDEAGHAQLIIIGDLVLCRGNGAKMTQMPQMTSRPGSRDSIQGSGNLQLNTCIFGVAPAAMSNSTFFQNLIVVKLISCYLCI